MTIEKRHANDSWHPEKRWNWIPAIAVMTIGMLFIMGTGCFSGCSQRVQYNETKPPTTLEFWTLQLMDFKDTLQPMFNAYEKSHPGIKIKWVDVPFSEGEKRTLTALMAAQWNSGNIPDVINLNPDFSAILASRKALVDMKHYLNSDQQKEYLPVAWDTSTLRLQNQQMTFGLPWYITSSVTIYNKALLQKAGFKQPPGNYNQLQAYAKTMKAKSGGYGLMPIITQNGNFLKELKRIGVSLYDPHSGRAIFADNPRAITHLERYQKLYRDGLIPAEALTEGHRAAVDRFQSGTLGMLLTGPNFLKIVNENAPDVFKHTDVAPQFPFDQNTAAYKDFALMILVVPQKSRHPKEAVEFARYITNSLNQLALSKAAPVLPSTVAALKDPYFTQQQAANVMVRARSISAQQLLRATEGYAIQPRQHDLNDIMDYVIQMTLLGKMTPKQALDNAQQQMNAIIQE